jgi:hypothetical protein
MLASGGKKSWGSRASSANVQRPAPSAKAPFPFKVTPSDMLSTLPVLTWLAGLAGLGVPGPVAVSRMVVHQELILRVPVIRPRLARPIRWEEKKGPKCIASGDIVAAALHDERSVDFLLRDRTRIRAKMDDDCPTLDFYGSFYFQPRDERICARREEIRSRMGQACRIDRFRRMVPRIP